MKLGDPITPGLLKTTQAFVDALEAMGIRSIDAFVQYLPRTHEDINQAMNLAQAPLGEKVSLRGTVHALKLVRTRNRKVLVQAQFQDEEGGVAQVIWFNQPHILRMLKEGQSVTLMGKVVENGLKLQIQSPTFEDAARQTLHAGSIVAVYPQTAQITSRWIREKMALLKKVMSDLPETLPKDVLIAENLMSRSDAVVEMHFSSSPEQLERARQRMAFEEMYAVQVEALERKAEWQGERQERLRTAMDVELIKAFFASLRFTPTGGQKVAIYEILKDMEQDRSMSRLLEGDVGSGKTLVTVAVMANVLRHGGQCALMVPTEVLARQHAATVSRLLLTFHSYIQSRGYTEKGIDADHLTSMRLANTALLTGSVPQAEADMIRRNLAAGLIDIVIGTHALIEDSVRFKDLKPLKML